MSRRRKFIQYTTQYTTGERPQVGDIVELDLRGASGGSLSSPLLDTPLDASMGYQFRVQNVSAAKSVSTVFMDGTPVCGFDDGHIPGVFKLISRGVTQSPHRRLTVRTQ